MTNRTNRVLLAAAALAALPLATACSSSSSTSTPTATASSTSAAAKAKPAVHVTPDTSASARSAAATFLALYSAGQWPEVWHRLTAAEQRLAPESVYVRFHEGCPSKAAGLAYKILGVTMAGKTAVITYTIPLVASLGSVTIAEHWTASGWRAEFTTGRSVDYTHGSVAADVAAAKAHGDCA